MIRIITVTLLLVLMNLVSALPGQTKVDVFAGQARARSFAESKLEERSRATYYNTADPSQNEGHASIGSCGNHIDDSMYIVAISSASWGSPQCGQTVAVQNADTGACVDAVVQDRCGGCDSSAIDLTPSLFQAVFGGGGIGNANWWFGSCGGNVQVASSPQQCSASDWTQCPNSGCCYQGQCADYGVCFGY